MILIGVAGAGDGAGHTINKRNIEILINMHPQTAMVVTLLVGNGRQI